MGPPVTPPTRGTPDPHRGGASHGPARSGSGPAPLPTVSRSLPLPASVALAVFFLKSLGLCVCLSLP